MSERNLLRERIATRLISRINDFFIDPSKRNAHLLDDEFQQLQKTYPQCELAKKYHGKDCQVIVHNGSAISVDARIVRSGVWAAIEFNGAQVTYSWEAVDDVMQNGGVFVI